MMFVTGNTGNRIFEHTFAVGAETGSKDNLLIK
jgi:hypothetical protein